jgi:hypothetical protein
MPGHEPGTVERRVIRVMQEKYVSRMPTESMRVRVARAPRAERENRYLDRLPVQPQASGPKRWPLQALRRLPLDIQDWFDVLDALTLGRAFEAVFSRFHPDLVATPTSGLYFSEGPLLGRARREGVPAMAIDLSWDHFTTKTAPLRPMAHLCVWNDQMREEALGMHGYRPDQVSVTGVPQFDQYAERGRLGSRSEFLESIGLPGAAPLVTLTTVPSVLYPRHDLVVDLLLAARLAGELPADAAFLVRVHQRDDVDQYQRFRDIPGLRVEKPFRNTIVAEGSSVDPSRSDRMHLAKTLLHSDAVVNVASTIALEAAILDTPIVNIGFDLPEKKPYLDSAIRFYDYTHYRPLVDAGAVQVARDPMELVSLVADALVCPQQRREERETVARRLASRADGNAAQRVANRVLETLFGGVS